MPDINSIDFNDMKLQEGLTSDIYQNNDLHDKLQKIAEAFTSLVNCFKEAIQGIIRYFVRLAEDYAAFIRNNNAVGYKRLTKMKELKEYERLSVGKSNNWRKNHELHLRRKL